MKYFKHQYSESFGEIWELFSDLANLSKEEVISQNSRREFGHTMEIINSAMNKKLDNRECFNLDSFDLRAYEAECRKKDEIKLNVSRKKYLTIVDTVNGNDDNVVGYGEISMNDTRLKSIEDAFALFDENDEFERCLSELYNIRKDYIITKGVDPVEMLLNSLKGIPEAVTLMAELVLEDLPLRQIIEGLCSNSKNTLQLRLEGSV
ncbi:hypothetical protein ACEE21_15325 [Clostridium baratii]